MSLSTRVHKQRNEATNACHYKVLRKKTHLKPMDRVYIAKDIVNTSLAHDAWVYGGYVRDVVVCGETEFNDVDICCPKGVDHTWIVRSLAGKYKVKKYNETSDYEVDSYTINDSVIVQFLSYYGDFEDWCDDHSTDLTCNLFYQTRYTHIGIRYIPKKFRVNQNPVGDIITMTKNKVFERISDPASSVRARTLLRRMRNMVVYYGWTCRNNVLGEYMDLCDDNYMKGIAASIQDFQVDRQKKELDKYSGLPPYLIDSLNLDYQ